MSKSALTCWIKQSTETKLQQFSFDAWLAANYNCWFKVPNQGFLYEIFFLFMSVSACLSRLASLDLPLSACLSLLACLSVLASLSLCLSLSLPLTLKYNHIYKHPYPQGLCSYESSPYTITYTHTHIKIVFFQWINTLDRH